MAKIIKVGSQNPTFTSQKVRKAASMHTRRNSNEATNPFKFTNFEGNTLQFADVFEGFKPNFKANKMRMVASSVAGSMNKMRSNIAEPIINFVKRVHSNVSNAWAYASSTSFTAAIADAGHAIKEAPVIKRTTEILNTPIHVPAIDGLVETLNTPIHIPVVDGLSEKLAGVKGGISSRIEAIGHKASSIREGISARCNELVSNISLQGKNKYANMSVAELESQLVSALAEGGV